MDKARRHYLQLSPPSTAEPTAGPYKDLLPVLRLSNARPAG